MAPTLFQKGGSAAATLSRLSLAMSRSPPTSFVANNHHNQRPKILTTIHHRRTFATTPINHNKYPDVSSHPFRSVLYVPASNTRALQKLETLSGSAKPDAVMFDLEDGVAPNKKEEARENLLQHLQNKTKTNNASPSSNNDYFGLVRINRIDTPFFEDDAELVYEMVTAKEMNVSGVVVPKIEGRKDIDMISQHFLDLCKDDRATLASATKKEYMPSTINNTLSPVPLWAMVETPLSILSASEIAAADSIQGLILGTNDLSKELRLQPTTSASQAGGAASSTGTREGLATSIQLSILAARAYDKLIIDGVYNNFRDEDGFQKECLQGKEWGIDGKTLIHPSQVLAANEILAPSAKEIERAKRVVACWEETTMAARNSSAGGGTNSNFTGVAVLDGMMIEQLHVDMAQRLLDQAARIEQMG